jgi:ssDNA-binding replication factor A large subunit
VTINALHGWTRERQNKVHVDATQCAKQNRAIKKGDLRVEAVTHVGDKGTEGKED